MFGYKASKENVGKVQNDPQGFFNLAKRSFLNAPAKFLEAMLKYDKDHIPDATARKMKVMLSQPDLAIEKVKNASGALAAIHMWAIAMMMHHEQI
jgi:hypothetical protein